MADLSSSNTKNSPKSSVYVTKLPSRGAADVTICLDEFKREGKARQGHLNGTARKIFLPPAGILAMHRHEGLRIDFADKLKQFFSSGMPGGVHRHALRIVGVA